MFERLFHWHSRLQQNSLTPRKAFHYTYSTCQCRLSHCGLHFFSLYNKRLEQSNACKIWWSARVYDTAQGVPFGMNIIMEALFKVFAKRAVR